MSGKFYNMWMQGEVGGVSLLPPRSAEAEEGFAQVLDISVTELKRLYTFILIRDGKEALSATLLKKISDPERINIKITNSSQNPSIYNIEMPAKAMVKDVLLAFSSMHGQIEADSVAIIDKQGIQVDDSMDLEKIGGFTSAKMDEYHEFTHEEIDSPKDFLRYNGTKKLSQEVGGGGAEPGGAGHAAPPAGGSGRREAAAAAAQERPPSAAEEPAHHNLKLLLIKKDDPTSAKIYTVSGKRGWVPETGGPTPVSPQSWPPQPIPSDGYRKALEALVGVMDLPREELKSFYTVYLLGEDTEEGSKDALGQRYPSPQVSLRRKDPHRIKIKVTLSSLGKGQSGKSQSYRLPKIYNIEMPADATVRNMKQTVSFVHSVAAGVGLLPEHLTLVNPEYKDRTWLDAEKAMLRQGSEMDEGMELANIPGFGRAGMDEYHEFVQDGYWWSFDRTKSVDRGVAVLLYNGVMKEEEKVVQGGGGVGPAEIGSEDKKENLKEAENSGPDPEQGRRNLENLFRLRPDEPLINL